MGLSFRAGLPLHLSLQLEAQESIHLLKLKSKFSFCFGLLHFGFFHALPESRLDYQPLFGKGACPPPPQGMFSMGGMQTRHKRAAEINPILREAEMLFF